jgi:dienelactone hydrolase
LRRFELVLVFASAFALGWPIVFGVRPRRGIVALVLGAALFAQLQFEGFRWQMIPLYLASIGLAIGDLIYLERRLDWSSRLLRLLLGTVGMLLAVALPVVLPVPELPTPSGPEPIGTFTVDLIDRSRDELWGPPPAGGPREFVAQVWYPSREETDAEPIPWSEDWEVVAPGIARQIGLPSWFLDHTRYTLSHAESSPPVAAGTFPVLIYSHDWGGVRTNTLNQIEHLVSNGYIVIAPDHTYGSVATVFEDGDIAPFDPGGLPDPATVSEEEYGEDATAVVATFASDLVTILTELEQGENGVFAEIASATDLNRIGVYGHGAGGGAAIKVCLEVELCAAVLAMDPWVEPLTQRDLQQEMTRPALYMRSEEWIGTPNDALLIGIAARGENVTYSVSIEDAWHTDFLMTPLLTPFAAQFGLRGPIPAGRIILITNNYLRGFFDVFLLDTGSAALDSVTFDEVDVSVIDPGE